MTPDQVMHGLTSRGVLITSEGQMLLPLATSRRHAWTAGQLTSLRVDLSEMIKALLIFRDSWHLFS